MIRSDVQGRCGTVLRARFKKVFKAVEEKVVLDSLAAHAATCESLDDFAKHLP